MLGIRVVEIEMNRLLFVGGWVLVSEQLAVRGDAILKADELEREIEPQRGYFCRNSSISTSGRKKAAAAAPLTEFSSIKPSAASETKITGAIGISADKIQIGMLNGIRSSVLSRPKCSG